MVDQQIEIFKRLITKTFIPPSDSYMANVSFMARRTEEITLANISAFALFILCYSLLYTICEEWNSSRIIQEINKFEFQLNIESSAIRIICSVSMSDIWRRCWIHRMRKRSNSSLLTTISAMESEKWKKEKNQAWKERTTEDLRFWWFNGLLTSREGKKVSGRTAKNTNLSFICEKKNKFQLNIEQCWK